MFEVPWERVCLRVQLRKVLRDLLSCSVFRDLPSCLIEQGKDFGTRFGRVLGRDCTFRRPRSTFALLMESDEQQTTQP